MTETLESSGNVQLVTDSGEFNLASGGFLLNNNSDVYEHQNSEQVKACLNFYPAPETFTDHRNGSANSSSLMAALTNSDQSSAGSGNQFLLDIKRIICVEEETRTTIMIRNIPNKYTQQKLLETLDSEGQ
jgi:hypothetical protein